MIRIAINGCNGRMGARVMSLAQHDDALVVAASLNSKGITWHDDVRQIDAVIDFSNDAGARSACNIAVDNAAALLVATTGLSSETHAAIDQASEQVPVILAANTSYGVAAVDNLITAAANMFDARFSTSIIETHHVRKRDRPSGTRRRDRPGLLAGRSR